MMFRSPRHKPTAAQGTNNSPWGKRPYKAFRPRMHSARKQTGSHGRRPRKSPAWSSIRRNFPVPFHMPPAWAGKCRPRWARHPGRLVHLHTSFQGPRPRSPFDPNIAGRHHRAHSASRQRCMPLNTHMERQHPVRPLLEGEHPSRPERTLLRPAPIRYLHRSRPRPGRHRISARFLRCPPLGPFQPFPLVAPAPGHLHPILPKRTQEAERLCWAP